MVGASAETRPEPSGEEVYPRSSSRSDSNSRTRALVWARVTAGIPNYGTGCHRGRRARTPVPPFVWMLRARRPRDSRQDAGATPWCSALRSSRLDGRGGLRGDGEAKREDGAAFGLV